MMNMSVRLFVYAAIGSAIALIKATKFGSYISLGVKGITVKNVFKHN